MLIIMSKQELVESLLFAGFRLMAVGLAIMGILSMVTRLADSWYRFDPSYFGAWFTATLLQPALFLAVAVFLFTRGPTLSKKTASRFSSENP